MSPNDREMFRVAVRKGTQQQSVHKAEDGGVRANAERQCNDGHRCESRLLRQYPCAVSQVTQERVHRTPQRIADCRLPTADFTVRSAVLSIGNRKSAIAN